MPESLRVLQRSHFAVWAATASNLVWTTEALARLATGVMLASCGGVWGLEAPSVSVPFSWGLVGAKVFVLCTSCLGCDEEMGESYLEGIS